MAFLIDRAYLPATLTIGPMTDEQFAAFCAEHPDLSFETTADGELIVLPPNCSLTGARSGEIYFQTKLWSRRDQRGVTFDASAGFVLANGARRSPDTAWVLKERIQSLPEEMIERYFHLCPDFIVEYRSATDRIRVLRAKMVEWIENGAQLGWLVDPETRAVEIYRPNRDVEISTSDTVEGDGPMAGFVLDLLPVWNPES
jgi:Uma2 family endonuclease